MGAYFNWLVRHEKLVAGVTLLLLVALAAQVKFCRPSIAPELTSATQGQTPAGSSADGAGAPINVAGRWEMSVQKPSGGAQTWRLTLAQQGASLSGTLNSEGGDLPVSGTIAGRSISLKAQRYGVTVEFPATVEGDTMTGTMRVLNITRQWTARRQD